MFQRSEITQSMFSNHNAIMLENNDEKIILYIWNLRNISLNGINISLNQRGNNGN